MTPKGKITVTNIFFVAGFYFLINTSSAQVSEGIELLRNSAENTALAGQSEYDLPYKKRKKINIQEVSLKDTLLIYEIKKLIKEESEQTDMFKKGLGYIEVFPDANEYLPHQITDYKNIRQCYYINVNYTALKSMKRESNSYSVYPDFYTFIDQRLVFIKCYTLNNMVSRAFTEKSMRKLRKIQNNYLEKTKRVTFYDLNKKKTFTDKHFRIDYHSIHGGKHIYIYRDKSYEIKQDPDRE